MTVAEPQQPFHHQQYPPGWYPPAPPTSTLAVVSLVFGILWLFWIGSLVAVISGHYALKECREKGLGGNGLAVAGLILGYIGLAALVVPLTFAAVGAAGNALVEL